MSGCSGRVGNLSDGQLKEIEETGSYTGPVGFREGFGETEPTDPAPPKTAKERLAICDECPALTRGIFGQKKCKVCGCAMTLKTAMKYAKCPMGRW